MENILPLIFVILLVGGISFIAVVMIVRNLLYVCKPNKVLIFSGGIHKVGDKVVGYRAITGGRAYRIPLMETVEEMDLSNINIEVAVANAYSKGGIPLKVQGVANLKVASHEPVLGNAIERFLGVQREDIERIAKDTLEGNLRGVLAQLTPEQVNEDKIAFAEKLLEEAEQDLAKLGLTLDTLKIQNVTDDVGYLNSIGRKSSADMTKRARFAEAKARTEAMVLEAQNRERARLADLESQKAIFTAQIQRRITEAVTLREARIAEEVGGVKANIAKVEAEYKAQLARVEQVRRQLRADVVEPARAAMEAAQAKARGDCQKIVEDGKATANVLNQMISTWQRGGTSARDIFLMQKLDHVMASLVGTIHHAEVKRLTMLPHGDHAAMGAKAVRVVEELKATLGVDLPAAFDRMTRGAPQIAPVPAPAPTPGPVPTPVAPKPAKAPPPPKA